jgi:hypothetical protein
MSGDFRTVDLFPGDHTLLLNRKMNSVVCMFLIFGLYHIMFYTKLRMGSKVNGRIDPFTVPYPYAGIPYLLPLDLLRLED